MAQQYLNQHVLNESLQPDSNTFLALKRETRVGADTSAGRGRMVCAAVVCGECGDGIMGAWGRRPSTGYLVERSLAGGQKQNTGLEHQATPFLMFRMHLNVIPAADISAQVDATADGEKYLLKVDTEGRMTHIFWMTATQVRGHVKWKEGRTSVQCK